MNQVVKRIIDKIPFYSQIRNRVAKHKQMKELVEWERNGKPVPPPHIVKQRMIQAYSKKYGLKILVETGTYYGDMIDAMKDVFDVLYSIELSRELYEKARIRFRGLKHIKLICGDSGVEIKDIVGRLDQPALFWLDGHYSGGVTAKGSKDTPIYDELTSILDSPVKDHVILIDDARCFGRDQDYPSIQELSDFIRAKRADLIILVQDDCMRITPRAGT